MKLKDAIEFGKDCGLNTVEECVSNIEIHAMNLFRYTEINKELKELYDEYNTFQRTGS